MSQPTPTPPDAKGREFVPGDLVPGPPGQAPKTRPGEIPRLNTGDGRIPVRRGRG
jgi:hypothetical protein